MSYHKYASALPQKYCKIEITKIENGYLCNLSKMEMPLPESYIFHSIQDVMFFIESEFANA